MQPHNFISWEIYQLSTTSHECSKVFLSLYCRDEQALVALQTAAEVTVATTAYAADEQGGSRNYSLVYADASH